MGNGGDDGSGVDYGNGVDDGNDVHGGVGVDDGDGEGDSWLWWWQCEYTITDTVATTTANNDDALTWYHLAIKTLTIGTVVSCVSGEIRVPGNTLPAGRRSVTHFKHLRFSVIVAGWLEFYTFKAESMCSGLLWCHRCVGVLSNNYFRHSFSHCVQHTYERLKEVGIRIWNALLLYPIKWTCIVLYQMHLYVIISNNTTNVSIYNIIL